MHDSACTCMASGQHARAMTSHARYMCCRWGQAGAPHALAACRRACCTFQHAPVTLGTTVLVATVPTCVRPFLYYVYVHQIQKASVLRWDRCTVKGCIYRAHDFRFSVSGRQCFFFWPNAVKAVQLASTRALRGAGPIFELSSHLIQMSWRQF